MCRSRIVGADTMDAKGIAVEGVGAIQLLTTDETDSGGGAGEENEVSDFFYEVLLIFTAKGHWF